ncbi:RNA-binding protein [Methanosarcinales archaeon]|nr:MAG: RNA-binding protein [Methanosarcinales archaeon]
MSEKQRIVIPGDLVSRDPARRGDGTYVRDGSLYASLYGLVNEREKIRVVPLSGKYVPTRRDVVVGFVKEVTFSNWIVDIGSPYEGLLHVSEYPRRIELDEMSAHLGIGEAVLVEVKEVDPMMKVELTMRDRRLRVIRSGRIVEISPSKVPRLIGHGGSMISLIKGASDCSIVVGQNGRVWINGKGCDEGLAAEAIDKIESESHIPGLTDRLGRFFEETKNDADLNESDSEEEVVVESGEEAGKGNNIIDELLE